MLIVSKHSFTIFVLTSTYITLCQFTFTSNHKLSRQYYFIGSKEKSQ